MTNALDFGGVVYDNDAIKSASAALDTSLNGRVLDVDTMQITVEDAAGGVTQFSQDEPASFLRGGSQYELWYPESVTQVAPALYLLALTSSLGRLARMEHRGGIYTGQTLGSLVDDICGVVPHYVAAAFASIQMYGYLPYVSPSGENGAQKGSAKDNLLKVLFAANANLRDDAQGVLRVENLSTAVSAILDTDRIYDNPAPRVVHDPPVTSVTVLEHQYIVGTEDKVLFEGTALAGQVIVFSEPMSNLAATGFSVAQSGANYAVLSAGTGQLTGRPYVHTTREITRAVAQASIPNPVRVTDQTLVGLTNSASVTERLAAYYACRMRIQCDVTVGFEDAGDVVSIYDPYAKTMRSACIEKISPLVVSNTMKGSVDALVGFLPWQTVPFEDVREVLTGAGTWTPPAGVTQVTVVLIDKGLDGTAGADGTQGTKNSYTGRIDRYNYTMSFAAGTPGKGGEAGKGGEGGRVLRVEITIGAGQSFAYSVGAVTTFGSYSSADGSRSASGYTDPVTGDVYALPGKDGVNGGDGGAGGSGSSGSAANGSSGGDAGNYTGGVGGQGYYNSADIGTDVGTQSEGGAGGGGASGNANGGNASRYVCGNGANAVQPAAKTVYGCGGDGGNGGGGSGAGGSAYWHYQRRNMSPSYINYTYDIYTVGTPGKGALGGLGMSGCIVAYYRRPVTE